MKLQLMLALNFLASIQIYSQNFPNITLTKECCKDEFGNYTGKVKYLITGSAGNYSQPFGKLLIKPATGPWIFHPLLINTQTDCLDETIAVTSFSITDGACNILPASTINNNLYNTALGYHYKGTTTINCTQNPCINFAGSYNLNNWEGWLVEPHMLRSDATHGNFLELKDDDGGSFEVNRVEFGGNWLTKSNDNCFCFDYNVDWSAGSAATIPVKAPKIGIFTGNNNTPNAITGIYASFVGNPSNPDLQNNTWSRFCLPVALCSGGNLPSNSYGSWKIMNGPTVLSGSSACTAWDNLIQNVSGIILFTDYNAFPGELVRFDNFCWSCQPPITCCTNSEWKSKYIGWSLIKDKLNLSADVQTELKKMNVPVDEEEPPVNNNEKTSNTVPVKSNNQIKKLPIGNTGSIGPISDRINITNCNTVYHLSQNGKYTLNADYQCGGTPNNCPKQVKVTIQGPPGCTFNGTYNVPYTQTFTQDGNYSIRYEAFCGTQSCAVCDFTLTIDKNCCLNGKWMNAKYQTVTKTGVVNATSLPAPLPLTLSSPIPTYSANQSVNISGLNYQCASGCTATYKVVKRNVVTGVQTTTILPAGTTSFSVTPLKDKQIIRVFPMCGTQQCSGMLLFNVICSDNTCAASGGSGSSLPNTPAQMKEVKKIAN